MESLDFARRLGLRVAENAALDPNSLPGYREAYVAIRRAYHAGEGNRMRSWNLPFLIRHIAFHVMDHRVEMQDQDLTAPVRVTRRPASMLRSRCLPCGRHAGSSQQAWFATGPCSETHSLPAGSLTLEITENVLMSDPDRAKFVLAVLHHIGVGFSIDDYRTGYSSLAYLQDLTVDELKIDRAFISRLTTAPARQQSCTRPSISATPSV
jgi:hypothetical protein